jgi:hypothetical protein
MKCPKQLFHDGAFTASCREEIQEHLREKIEQLVAGGTSRKEASAAARRQFGNVTLIEEDSRTVRQWPLLTAYIRLY